MSLRRALAPAFSALAITALALMTFALAPALGRAEPLADDGGAEWRLEQPEAPEAPPGVERPTWLVGLGHIGDIEFYSPNRGALITAGNGSTVPAGVWLYNGVRWRELSTVCGATDGRIAWAGPDEFWTVSDGRPGQGPDSRGDLPSLQDNTLCRFAVGAGGRFEVVGSYATLAFQSTSYRAMHGAVCLAANDCWFGGDPLEAPGEGAFQLHWDGATMTASPYVPEGHAVEEIRDFEGSAFESLKLLPTDTRVKHEAALPPLRRIAGGGLPPSYESQPNVPLYSVGESPLWLGPLHLGADEQSLWAAAGPSKAGSEAEEHEPGVTIARYSKLEWVPVLEEFIDQPQPVWSEVLGPGTSPTGIQAFGKDTTVMSIAAEPGTSAAWLSVDSRPDSEEPVPATQTRLARIGADGAITDRTTLTEGGAAVGPKGAGEHLACPAAHDCWLVTTQGWLFHLSNAEEAGGPPDSAFAEVPGETPISTRPIDEGVPQSEPDSIPEDTSGEGQNFVEKSVKELLKTIASPFATITLPLVSGLHSKLVHRTTLELSFRLAVKARIRLIAKRKKKVVAETRTQTLGAGKHTLELKLDPRRWPTQLHLEEHPLAPLPTTSTQTSNVGTIGTSERLPDQALVGNWSALP